MQSLPPEFEEWFGSLKIVRANQGPAKGTIAAALVVLDRLKKEYDLDILAHIAPGGTQIKGASGAAVSSILKSFGETRAFAREGGRTNRGLRAEIQPMLASLKDIRLEEEAESVRNAKLESMQAFLVEKVRDYHNRQKIKFNINPSNTTWTNIHNLLQVAASRQQSGYVAQHLVGAKLALRFPDYDIANESGSTADIQTKRPGDFLIGNTAIHVTVDPMPPLYDKCVQNIENGFRPLLLIPDSKLIGARQIADQSAEGKIDVESIETFVSQNINEIGKFDTTMVLGSLQDLIKIYNERVDAVETDKSLKIELSVNI